MTPPYSSEMHAFSSMTHALTSRLRANYSSPASCRLQQNPQHQPLQPNWTHTHLRLSLTATVMPRNEQPGTSVANILLPHELVHSVSSAASGWGQLLIYHGRGCDDGPHALATQQASWHVLRTIAEEETASALSGLCTTWANILSAKASHRTEPSIKVWAEHSFLAGRALQTYWVEEVDTGRGEELCDYEYN